MTTSEANRFAPVAALLLVLSTYVAGIPELVTPGNLGDELASFIRAMRANNVSPTAKIVWPGRLVTSTVPR